MCNESWYVEIDSYRYYVNSVNYICWFFQVQNIDDVLQRGTVLSELDSKTQNLSMLSQKYKKDATYLNRKSMYVKAAAAGIVFLVFIIYFWIL